MKIKLKVMEDRLLVNKIETRIEMLKVHNLNLNNIKTMVKKDHLLDTMTVMREAKVHHAQVPRRKRPRCILVLGTQS
jgi:hypothetical protein